MAEQLISGRPPIVGAAGAVQRAGTATDRKPRRQEGEDKRKPGEGPKKRRHLYDLLFDEIDQVPELETHQRERLKRNIRAHLAMRARDQTPLPSVMRDAPETEPGKERPPPDPEAESDQDHDHDHDHETLITIAAPAAPDLPKEELDQNAELAAQLRYCLSRHSESARKVAAYLKILLSIDGALAPHVVIDI